MNCLRFACNNGRRRIILWLVMAATPAAWALNPASPPGGNFNLTNWSLTLPVDSSGGITGSPVTISAAQLTAGYTNPPFFFTATNDGAMVFYTPASGAHTSGSTHPRTELREQIVPGSTVVNWTGNGTHVLNARCQVNTVSNGCMTCIGQIHGKSVDLPLVMIDYDSRQNNGTINVFVKYNTNDVPVNGHVDSTLTFANVGLNTDINYQLLVTNGVVFITINGVTQSQNFYAYDTNWATVDFYFKAGNYYVTSTNNNPAQVSFYSLTASHAPAITNQPASQTINAGSNAVFNVGAIGKDALSYQWWFNATNLFKATNASLTITNAQSTNAGNYAVVVSDSISSITSSVAVLTINVPATVAPATNRIRISGTTATIGVAGSPATSYVLQTTTNLLGGWTPVQTNTTDGGGLLNFTDTNATNQQQFYRTVH
jgi:hypothetical protein